ncbi:hypothetical protein Y1Q_0005351 [Alligator mississippiensis]|uniref:Uncharacterized protein n=1 Tax=Alligator mississippiensis TaxID=8496 RepID=A0A151MVN5_ALLMI|nr:hypothetical protein Y1Q_0005351 [Alligator mississippiensis]
MLLPSEMLGRRSEILPKGTKRWLKPAGELLVSLPPVKKGTCILISTPSVVPWSQQPFARLSFQLMADPHTPLSVCEETNFQTLKIWHKDYVD